MNNPLIFTGDADSALRRLKLLCRTHGVAVDSTDLEAATSLDALLQKIPVIDKQGLSDFAARERERFLSEGILFSETSGSTGEPLPTPRNQLDLQWNILNQINAYKRHLSPGDDRIAIVHPSILSPFVEATAMALRELSVGYVRVFPIPGLCDYQRIYDVFQRYRISAVMTTPTLAYKVFYELKKIGNGVLPSGIRHVLLTGESISNANMRNMDAVVGVSGAAKPFVYGSSETAVLMYGKEDGSYRPYLDDFVFEVHRQGDAAEDGSVTGILVVSWLRDGLLPIVRYNTGDIFNVRTDPDSGELIFRALGRVGTGDVSMQRTIDEAIFTLPENVYDYSVRDDGSRLEIHIVTESSSNQRDTATVEQQLASAIRGREISCTLNNDDARFHEFSPVPKIRRYVRC